MGKKKLMLLGGLRYLIPVIKVAHKLDIYVITVDYVPHNIAHKYSDEYYNISILDKEAVLTLAQKLQIDGIMSFAVDPGVVTAAYVAEKMGLPFQGSFKSVSILQDKSLFRNFLAKNNFKVPRAKGYNNLEAAIEDRKSWKYPVIVKPVDSAGSKGVSRVDSEKDLNKAIKIALEESHIKKFIIEDFIIPKFHTSDSDCFTVNGELSVCSFSNQYFDKTASNPYTPAAYSWPSSMPMRFQDELKTELQRLMFLLEMKTGIYNIETRIGKDGNAYIMEVSPRGGGNRLAEMVDNEYNTNLIENSVRNAVGLNLLEINVKEPNEHLVEIIIHSDRDGKFEELEISEEIMPFLVEKDLWVLKGEEVYAFRGANNSMGTLVFKIKDLKVCERLLNNPSSYYNIILQ